MSVMSPTETQIDVLSENAADVRDPLIHAGRFDEADLIGKICAAADVVAMALWNLDSTTDGDVAFNSGISGAAPADGLADPFVAICASVRRLQSRFGLALTTLRRRKGPEARLSLSLLVSQLCDLWGRETGKPVTANPVREGSYTGRPHSACGRFVCAAVEALQPTAAWIEEREAPRMPLRAAIVTGPSGARVQAVHSAMRAYVAAIGADASAPRRGRPRQK